MRIEITAGEAAELIRRLAETKAGPAPAGWVAHPIADLTKEPPSVMTVATAGEGADIDIDKEKDVPEDGWRLDKDESYARATEVASFIIKNLLDFEAWLDGRLSNDDDATVERVRFHAVIEHDGRITMRHLTEYRYADRCIVPREDMRIRAWELPDDEALEDFEAEVVGSCVEWVCNELGMDIDEYLGKDGKSRGG